MIKIKLIRRQSRKGKPFWIFDKFEIDKINDSSYILYDITNYSLLGYFENLIEAKNFIEDLIN